MDWVVRLADRVRGAGPPSRARRAGIVLLGCVVLLAGAVLVPLPGPGLPVVAVGLALLAGDCRWARSALARIRALLGRRGNGPGQPGGPSATARASTERI